MSVYAILALVVAIIGFIVWDRISAKKAGEDEMRLQEEEADAEAAKRILDAQANAPRDDDAFDKRLRDERRGL